MTLIAILISLLLERLLDHVQDLRRYERYADYIEWMRRHLQGDSWDGRLGVLVLLAPPVLITAVLQAGLEDALFGLLGLLFAIAVLLFCLGPRDLGHELARYREALSAGDDELATRLARTLLGHEPPPPAGAQARAVIETVLVQANVRVFGVLFWFVILGPVGAVLYRAVTELRRHTLQDSDEFAWATRQLTEILDWVPARLTAMGYALSGDFEAAVARWRAVSAGTDRWLVPASQVLIAAGCGALDVDEDEDDDGDAVDAKVRIDANVAWDRTLQSAMALVWRTLSLWVVVIALLTLAGWAG
ncbi:MAG: regulatory signaling modulator protein AmpE [Gammaproteobacteria bacterium]|nr:regulatory signaling modulator protein AmpE [Gammaproteobacteria bacterium]